MGDVNLDDALEIDPNVFKRLGDCTGSEIESTIRLIVQNRIDRAWVDEQAAGSDRGELTIARRFFANTTEAERDLIAYCIWSSLVAEQRLRVTRGGDARGPAADGRLSEAGNASGNVRETRAGPPRRPRKSGPRCVTLAVHAPM